jgi:hypothetical protein
MEKKMNKQIHPKIIELLELDGNGSPPRHIFLWVLIHKPTGLYVGYNSLQTGLREALNIESGAFGVTLTDAVQRAEHEQEWPWLGRQPISDFEVTLRGL